ncbi:unnamed protein product [Amoebophrya sp. A120]|nr:unnamed protein product [Amoebophrya sp. A120]|eukprot:GSA120T00018346001.1
MNGDHVQGVLYPVPPDKMRQQGAESAKWMLVTAIKRRGQGEWQPLRGEQWMPDNGGPSNGGQWLHPIEE